MLYASCFMVCGGDMTTTMMMLMLMLMLMMVMVVVMVVLMLKEVVFVLVVEVVEVEEVVITGTVAYRPHYHVVLIEQVRVRREGHDDKPAQHNGQFAQVN